MKPFIAIAISLLLAASSASGQELTQEKLAAQENLQRAEQLADRFVQRFKETLDFEVVYREFFPVDLKERLPNSMATWGLEEHQEMLKKISPAEAEQAYIAFMNIYYVAGLYHINVLTQEEEGNDEINLETVYPPELVETMKRPSFGAFFAECFKDNSHGSSLDILQSAESIKRYIKDAPHLISLFRKYMPPQPFDSENYKAYLKELVWDGRETSVKEGDDYFGVNEATTVYQVYREMFVLNIIGENGEMRVIGIPFGN